MAHISFTTGKFGASAAIEPRDDVLDVAIDRARAGDREAFDVIVHRCGPRVASVAWRILGNEEDARDAAQEVFLRVFRYLGSFRGGECFQAWLYRIAINTCRDARRRRARRASRQTDLDHLDVPDSPMDSAGSPEVQFLAAQRRALVMRALDDLADREREAFVLRDLEGLSTAEVAAVLGMRPVTVRSYVSTARSKVRAYCSAVLDECVRVGGGK